VAEIEGHLSEAIGPGASKAQALTVLDRLGEPEAIIAPEMSPAGTELQIAADPRSGPRSSCFRSSR
jgi:hypothetical protein